MKKIIAVIVVLSSVCLASISIDDFSPTIFFPRQGDGTIANLADVAFTNSGHESDVQIVISDIGQSKKYTSNLTLLNGGNKVEVPAPADTASVKVVVYSSQTGRTLATRVFDVTPQKKWNLYCMSVSHQDLGFIDYYQLVRRHVREGGIDKALEYCRLTDDWPEDAKFRWTVETSEPVIRWVSISSPEKVAEFVARVKEGRISLGALHNSISTEMAGYEVFARSFYTPNRYVVDMLGIEPAKVAIIDDVPGFTRSLPLYLKEAGIPFFMHGSNHPNGLIEAIDEPVFYWTSPDNDKTAVLCRTDSYYSPNRIRAWDQTEIKRIVDRHINIDWKYDCILAYDSEDFIVPSMDNAENIRKWNEKWAYPKVICSTVEMFFDKISSQINPDDIKRYDKDAPDAWADQDITDAALLAKARSVTEKIPTAEKFSTFAMALSGGYPEKDIWQAYNRMVMYHEHTNGAIDGGRPAYYETEKVMHGTLVSEAEDFCDAALSDSIADISGLIKTEGDTLVVYNPLNWQRNDTVFVDELKDNAVLTDNVSDKPVKTQKLVNGKYIFVAENVPSLGYKTFSLSKAASTITESELSQDTVCENDYYRIQMDKQRNIITSVFDKSLNRELLDLDSPYHLGEYLYYNHTYRKLNRAVFTDILYYKGDVADEIHIMQDTPDTDRLELVIYIYKDIDRIDFDIQLDKLSNGNTLNSYNRFLKEAIYCAIPLKVPDFEINHELSGAVVEPATNQFNGSETSFYAIQHFSDVSNSQYGITLSTKECPVMIYGYPRVATWDWNVDHESIMQKPVSSNMFLYLMNNMFFTNIRIDQPGEKRFRWSLKGHEGNWQQGGAYKLGWDTSNSLFAVKAGKNPNGSLNGKSHSFIEVDADNVICSTVKPAESNGSGYILRFFELSGKDTTVNVTASFINKIDAAVATTLIENDCSPIKITSDNSFSFDIKGSGLKTIRITGRSHTKSVKNVIAKAKSDMRIGLVWSDALNENVSHYAVYRGLDSGFNANSSSFIGTSKDAAFTDMPRLNFAGWPNNVLEPDTKYYYKVCAVDKYNNKSELSDTIACRTLKTSQSNEKPLKVEGLYAVYVSPSGPQEYVNLWFYTNCEPDVSGYEIYRDLDADFTPGESNRIGVIDVENETEKYYGKFAYNKKELNRQMFADKTAQINTVYYYKVCAVDKLGIKGELSEPVRIEMSVPQLVISSDISKDIDALSAKANIEIKWLGDDVDIYYTLDGSKPMTKSIHYDGPFVIENSTNVRAAAYRPHSNVPVCIVSKHFILNRVFSQSDYAPEYSADRAVDGAVGPGSSWVSSPYGGQAKENARDIWFTILLPKKCKLKGLYIIGDDRDIIAQTDRFQVYTRQDSSWILTSDVKDKDPLVGKKNNFKVYFDDAVETDAVKLHYPKEYLPFSENREQDGIVRIFELKFILEDNSEVDYKELD